MRRREDAKSSMPDGVKSIRSKVAYFSIHFAKPGRKKKKTIRDPRFGIVSFLFRSIAGARFSWNKGTEEEKVRQQEALEEFERTGAPPPVRAFLHTDALAAVYASFWNLVNKFLSDGGGGK